MKVDRLPDAARFQEIVFEADRQLARLRDLVEIRRPGLLEPGVAMCDRV
jgi:hypothetical protein